MWLAGLFVFFFFNDTATTEIYTLSLHDALPICARSSSGNCRRRPCRPASPYRDRKSTRLNSSHLVISYAVFCLQKKTPRLLRCSFVGGARGAHQTRGMDRGD